MTNYPQDFGRRRSFSMLVIFNDSIETWESTSDSVMMLFFCNRKEDDTRLVLHACLQEINVVIFVEDTNVLTLLIHAYEEMQLKCSWHVRINIGKYMNF